MSTSMEGSVWVKGGAVAAGLPSALCCLPRSGHPCDRIGKRGLLCQRVTQQAFTEPCSVRVSPWCLEEHDPEQRLLLPGGSRSFISGSQPRLLFKGAKDYGGQSGVEQEGVGSL